MAEVGIMAQTKSIEALLNELDEITDRMDNDDVTLEESFKLYEKGVKLCKQCNEKIDKVEKQIQIIGENENNGV